MKHSLTRRLICTVTAFWALSIKLVLAQPSYDIAPGSPAVLNGVEYGVEVLNERSSDEYNRYELGLYVTNKSGCAKIIIPRQTLFGTETNPNLLANFDCLNATGKRLTSKSGTLLARPFVVPYRQTTKGPDGKDVTTTTNVQVGYVLRNGENVGERIIVIVPTGEQPRMRVRIREIVDNF